MISRTGQGFAAVVVGLSVVIAVAAPWASAAQPARTARGRALHVVARARGFGAFPRRLVPAARELFHAQVGSLRPASARTPLIVGGMTADQGTFGYMATVIYYDSVGNPLFLCSGTLVSSNVVLTAGHCGANETTGIPNVPSQYRVITNAVDWTDTTDRVVSDASQVVVDSNFNPSTLYGDASMLVLSAPVSDPTIPLWASGQFSAGTGAVIAGWGETYAGQPGLTTALQWAPTVLQNIAYCSSEAIGVYDYDSGTELCAVDAPYDDTGTCPGDSGRPAARRRFTGCLDRNRDHERRPC